MSIEGLGENTFSSYYLNKKFLKRMIPNPLRTISKILDLGYWILSIIPFFNVPSMGACLPMEVRYGGG